MKKLIPILLIAFVSLLIYSCNSNRDNSNFVDNDTVGTAFDITPNFTRTDDNLYQYVDSFSPPLVRADIVLVYLQTGLTNNNSPIWRLLPYTFYDQNNNAVDYSFDFSRFDIGINVNSGDINLTANPEYYTNRRFRVVILPADPGRSARSSSAAAPVDYNDYNSVIKYYNIDESKIRTRN